MLSLVQHLCCLWQLSQTLLLLQLSYNSASPAISVSFQLQPYRTSSATTLCCIFAAPAFSNASPMHLLLQPYCASATTTDSMHIPCTHSPPAPQLHLQSLLHPQFGYLLLHPRTRTLYSNYNLKLDYAISAPATSRIIPASSCMKTLCSSSSLPRTNLFLIFEYLLSDLRIACS